MLQNKHFGRKLNRPWLFKITVSSDIWSHFYGFLTVLGLVFTVLYTYFAFKEGIKDEEIWKIVLLLCSSLIVLLVVLIFNTRYFSRRVTELSQIPQDYNFLREEKDRFDIVLNQISECSHIITHYYRNINARLNQILENPDEFKEPEILENLQRFDDFLINITANLKSYFTLITNDNCSITIKLLNKENGYVKTFFRDPVNFKKRKDSDFYNNGKCHYSDNTAFEIIMDEKYSNIYFSEDDLTDLHNIFQYKNPNPIWYKYYNSTLVVPISMVLSSNDREIIGFLSVDNFKGNLASNANKEYLFFVADLLYCIFVTYSNVIKFAQSKGISHEKISRFANWN